MLKLVCFDHSFGTRRNLQAKEEILFYSNNCRFCQGLAEFYKILNSSCRSLPAPKLAITLDVMNSHSCDVSKKIVVMFLVDKRRNDLNTLADGWYITNSI